MSVNSHILDNGCISDGLYDNKNQFTEFKDKGFVFSFKRYSRINPCIESLLQRTIEACVHGITQSDYIHVEVIPVVQTPDAGLDIMKVYPFTFTAFAMQGFTCNLTENCMGGDFVHVYVPLTASDTSRGIEFFNQMRGWNYHYWAAIKAMMFGSSMHQPLLACNHSSDISKQRVFCSEAALLMCKHIGLYRGEIQPSKCMPQQLYDLIMHMPDARVVENIQPVHHCTGLDDVMIDVL